MWIETLNAYFSELQQSSKELSCLEGNLSVYLGMTHFSGLAPGAEREATRYMVQTPIRILELQTKLNITPCTLAQRPIKLRVVPFPSNPGHLRNLQ